MMDHTNRQLLDRGRVCRPLKPSAGFTLIEILVAVLVLSLGVLGLIAMEGLALKNNHSAYQRTQATLLSYDLADRIRANSANMDEYDDGATPATGSMAESDLDEWEARLEELLPGATSTRTASVSSFTVAISWADNRELDGNTDTQFSNSFRP